MAPTEDRVAKSERRWGCCRGIPTRPLLSMGFDYQRPSWQMTSSQVNLLVTEVPPTEKAGPRWPVGWFVLVARPNDAKAASNITSTLGVDCHDMTVVAGICSPATSPRRSSDKQLSWGGSVDDTGLSAATSLVISEDVKFMPTGLDPSAVGPASSLQVPVSTRSSIPFTQFLSTASPSVGTRCLPFTRCTGTLTTKFTTASVMAASSSTVVSTQFLDLSFASFTCFLARRDLCDDWRDLCDDVESWAVASGSRWCFAQCSLSLSRRELL